MNHESLFSTTATEESQSFQYHSGNNVIQDSYLDNSNNEPIHAQAAFPPLLSSEKSGYNGGVEDHAAAFLQILQHACHPHLIQQTLAALLNVIREKVNTLYL